ncbi:hypothetical protein GGI20_001682 [Coemansia sp. BCRC 34301]|nr:hypothetical protein GGI20_001682 [Coemansia sp. BCRC 34301]
MDPSALVRVCGLEMVCHTTMEAQPDAVLMSPDSQCFGSSGGYALLGSFRVAERAEAYDYAPFYIPAGCIVFSDYDMQVPRKEIRAATGISGIPYSQLSESPSHSQVNQGGGNRLTQASQSQATASQNPEPDDCHLLVHRDRVESYSGLITRVVDATLGIYLVDNCHILMLAFWPPLSLLPVLRPGTRVLLDSVHVLLMANSKSYHWSWLKRIWPQPLNQSIPADEHRTLVFGACTRSSVRIAAFPDTTTPSPAHLLMAESLAAYVVKQAGGLVQMVEAIEAFWKLQVKFPDGLSAKSVNTLQTTSGVDRSSGEVMDLALRLTGQHRTSAAGKTSGHRRLYIEFLDHTRCTSVDCLDGHPVSRVVALGDIVQRFLSQKSENRGLKPSSAVQAYSKPTHKVRSTQEVRVTNTYPAELSFGAFPLIGRLVLRQRGVLYLQDATGWLQIRPTTVSIPSADSGNPEMVRLQFSGQALVGHIYSWGQWRLTSESISIAPAGNNFNISLGSSTTVTAPFELVYVAAATPTIIYADHSFGRGSSSNATTKCTDTNVVQCFLLVVHTSSPVAIASRSKRRKSGTDNVGGTSPSGTRAWTPYIAVKGAGLKIGYSELHNLVKGGGNGVKRDSVLCVSVGETNELLNCVVSYDPDELPVSLMPGSAYVVCTDDPSAITRFGVSDMDVQIVLKNTCHVHPVWVTLADGSDDGDKPYAGMHHRELLSQASGGGKPLHIPTIRVDSTHSKILGAIWPSPVYPVRELHSLVAGLLRAGPGASEDSRPGDIISVHGTIDRRSIKQAISFTSSSGSAGDVQLGSKRSKASSDSAGPRVLCFDTRIVLRDSRDSDSTITLYTELSSFAHPLGLVPGTRVVVRDVRLEMAKNSGRAYLRGVAATSFQEIATELEPDQLVTEHKQTTEDFESKRVCVGQLYGLRVGKVTFNCTICAVEQLHLSVTCKKCKQAVCGLLCACLGRRHEPAARPAAAVADVELQCRVADGSGTARLLAHDGTALAEALGLSEAEISGLLATAAQSSSGRLLWTPQLEGQDVDTDCVITRAAAASLGTALRVEGMLQREQLPPMNGQRQPLRVGGQAVLFCQQTAPRVAALQIARLSMPALCWQLLADLSESYA